jgi:CHASE2 domain-containing sensor protein
VTRIPATLRRRLIKALPLILLVAAATAWLDHLRFFDRFEMAGLDAFAKLQPGEIPDDVVLVGISDADYKTLFRETSPLDCAQVQRVLNAIAADRPAVIGVDIDTSSPGFGCLTPADDWPPLVWATEAILDEERGVFTDVAPVTGRLIRADDVVAIAQFPEDPDGVVRRYRREFTIEGHGTVPSFPWAIVQAACKRGCDECCEADVSGEDASESLRLNFSGDRFDYKPLSVEPVLEMIESKDTGTAASAIGTQGPFTGKIVVFGGNYKAARDTQRTPLGVWPGMNVIAQAIESDLHGGGIHAQEEWTAIGLDVAIGLVLVIVNYWIMSRRWRRRLGISLAVSLLGIPLLCLVASLIAFSTSAFWFNFVPVTVSVLIHEFYEHAKEYQHLLAQHGL